MADATELAAEAFSGPLPASRLRLERRLGAGTSAEVFQAFAADGAPVQLKLGLDASALPSLIRDATGRLFGGSAGLQQPIAIGWFEASQRAATPSARGCGRPGLILAAREGSAAPEAGSPLDHATRIATSVGEALGALHEGGVAHGDLKPANVAFDERGAFLIDLGLSCPSATRTIEGATPRYLALDDNDLGDARARDLLAFGVLLAETLDAGVRSSGAPVVAARQAVLPAPFDEIVAALVAQSPEVRPSARWVARRAQTGAPSRALEHGALRVRNTYLALRRDVVRLGLAPREDAAPWLAPLSRWGRALLEAAGCGDSASGSTELLSEAAIGRWITMLVGSSALGWPLSRLAAFGERELALALTALARSRPAHAITLSALETQLRGGVCEALLAFDDADPSARAASLAIELARTPPSESAIRAVEDDASSPEPLVLAAAKAVRLRGEPGRAAALARRLQRGRDVRSIAASAELERRIGDLSRAELFAKRALAVDPNQPTARACLARLALDRGEVEQAIAMVGAPDSVATSEVAALALARKGDLAAALAALDNAQALPADAEERARLFGARGYVLAASQPDAARAAFATAADHAAGASALLEEATYLTGLAASATDLGYLQEAFAASERACLLWDHLGHTARAARAALNGASALAVAGRFAEARLLGEDALARATTAADTRAAGYAALVVADASEPNDARGRALAEQASVLLAPYTADALRTAARALRFGLLGDAAIGQGDRLAAQATESPAARLEWCAERLAGAASGDAPATTELISHVVSLIASAAPLGTRGSAAAHAWARARDLGLGDTSLRLAAALRSAAEALQSRAGQTFAASATELWWVRAAGQLPKLGGDSSVEQSARLEQLVRSLGSGATLKQLLRDVLDALVAWTGVERGLLLLLGPEGRLVPRVARNLGERDLRGDQLRVSTSLAERALRELAPVVAVDAAREFPDLHASVQALRLRSVLAVPLIAEGRALGVVYLDDRVRRGAFGERELTWVRTLSTLAATMVARAMSEAKLRRFARRAERKGRELELLLDERDARLAVVETTLSTAKAPAHGRAFDPIVGESESLAKAVRIAERVAASAVPVLLVGESGSGKELFARAIHDESSRGARAFVSENISAIPDTLLESALFGHVRGAFTGADRTRLGLFDAADRGTLFLDEIGEMRLSLQTKLLRVLEDGIVRPLGTERTQKVDVRLITATNRDLERMAQEHTFREDLYYRLGVVTIRIPPLRERPADIAVLVAHFLNKHGDPNKPGQKVRITRGAMKVLEAFPWPGNVRQLENEIRRALVLGDGVIEAEHLSINGRPSEPAEQGLDVKKRIAALEIALVRQALEQTQNNQTQAAKLLGLSRFGLQKMIKRLHIESR